MLSPNENGPVDFRQSSRPEVSSHSDSTDRLKEVQRLPACRLQTLRERYRVDVAKAWKSTNRWASATEAEIVAECDRRIAADLPAPAKAPELPEPRQPNLPSIPTKKLSDRELRIWTVLVDSAGGYTRDELVDVARLPIQSVTPIVTELIKRGFAVETAEERQTRCMKPAKVVKAVAR